MPASQLGRIPRPRKCDAKVLEAECGSPLLLIKEAYDGQSPKISACSVGIPTVLMCKIPTRVSTVQIFHQQDAEESNPQARYQYWLRRLAAPILDSSARMALRRARVKAMTEC